MRCKAMRMKGLAYLISVIKWWFKYTFIERKELFVRQSKIKWIILRRTLLHSHTMRSAYLNETNKQSTLDFLSEIELNEVGKWNSAHNDRECSILHGPPSPIIRLPHMCVYVYWATPLRPFPMIDPVVQSHQ